MTGAPSDAVARAADLATRMARNRGDMDEKSFADAVLRELRAERLVAAMVPGPGSDAGIGVGDVARIVHHLGRVSGSVGLIYAMHASQALSLARHAADRPLLTAFLHRLVEEQVLIASGTSEKGVGGDIFRSVCKVEEDRQGGLLVTKDCANISYMEQAGALLLTAMRDTGGQPAQVLILAQAEDMRIEPGPAVGFIGMRGIVNRPYVVTARFSSDAIFAEPYSRIATKTMTPSIHIFWAALWSGIARHVIGKARACCADLPANSDVAHVTLTELTRLVDAYHAMNALIRDAIAGFEDESRRGGASMALGISYTAQVKRLKILCSDLLNQVCQGGLRIAGMRGFAEAGPHSLSEPLRDALSAPVMISNIRLALANAKVERFIDDPL